MTAGVPGDAPPDKVAGIEARGFILGAPVAQSLGVGFVPVRKKGKLPGDVVAASYDLEYGVARPSRSPRTPSARATACWSSTTCWPPAVRRPPPSS